MGEIMSTYWETYGEENYQGFDIVFSIAPEDLHPSECFDTSTDPDTGKPYFDTDQMIKDIDSGRLYWFIARVEAFKNGILLTSEYLGGNLYEDPTDFIRESGCYEEMKNTVIEDAKQVIKKLTEDIAQ
jgi:hypothetical protein